MQLRLKILCRGIHHHKMKHTSGTKMSKELRAGWQWEGTSWRLPNTRRGSGIKMGVWGGVM
jgi:hypothetical protein